MTKIKDSIELLTFERIHPILARAPMLDSFELNGIYSLGVLSESKYITVASQQRRAIALAKSLDNIANEKIKKTDISKLRIKIAIIGGGFGGVSLAIYLMNLNSRPETKVKYKIELIESSNSLCHLQKNCHIRRLHPNVSSWPLAGWNNKETNHDVKELNWKADTASAVANSITQNIYKILEDREGQNRNNFLQIYTNCNEALISQSGSKFNLTITGDKNIGELAENIKAAYSCRNVDIIFIASGFGVERSLHSEIFLKNNIRTSSYWRNESFSQTNLNRKDGKYLVSGNGDGGVVDLFRLLIDGYAQDESLENIIPIDIDNFKKFKSHPYFEYPLEENKQTAKLRIEIKKNMLRLDKLKEEMKDSSSEEVSKDKLLRLKELQKNADDIDKKIQKREQKREKYETNVEKFKKEYKEFIEELISMKSLETSEDEKIFDWLEKYFSKKNTVLEFIRGLLIPKLTQNNVIFHIKSKNIYKNKIEAVIENTNITFYNRILFYFVWCFADFEIVKSDKDDILDIAYKYNISPENIIVRHGVEYKTPIKNIFSDSGFPLELDQIIEIKRKNSAEIVRDYRFDSPGYLKKIS